MSSPALSISHSLDERLPCTGNLGSQGGVDEDVLELEALPERAGMMMVVCVLVRGWKYCDVHQVKYEVSEQS